jgi:hypothetical protein
MSRAEIMRNNAFFQAHAPMSFRHGRGLLAPARNL